MAWSGETVIQIITSSFLYEVPIEEKALSGQIFASIEQLSENKECNGVGWLLLSVVKT